MWGVRQDPMDALDDAKAMSLRDYAGEIHITRTHQGYRAIYPDQKHYGTVMAVLQRDMLRSDLI